MADFELDATVVPEVDQRAKRKLKDELSVSVQPGGGGEIDELSRGGSMFGMVDNHFEEVLDELRELNDTVKQFFGTYSTTVTARSASGGLISSGISKGNEFVRGEKPRTEMAKNFGEQVIRASAPGALQAGSLVASSGPQVARDVVGGAQKVGQGIRSRGAQLIDFSRSALRDLGDVLGEKLSQLGSTLRSLFGGDDRGSAVIGGGAGGIGIRAISSLLGGGAGVAGAGIGAGAGVAGTAGFGALGLLDRFTNGGTESFQLRNIARGADTSNTVLESSDDPSEGIDPGQSLSDFAGERFNKTLFQPARDRIQQAQNLDTEQLVSDIKKQFGNISLNIDSGRLPDLSGLKSALSDAKDVLGDFSWPSVPDVLSNFKFTKPDWLPTLDNFKLTKPDWLPTLDNFSWPSLPEAIKNFKLTKPDWVSSVRNLITPSEFASDISSALGDVGIGDAIDLSAPTLDFSPNLNLNFNISPRDLFDTIKSKLESLIESLITDQLDDFVNNFQGR